MAKPKPRLGRGLGGLIAGSKPAASTTQVSNSKSSPAKSTPKKKTPARKAVVKSPKTETVSSSPSMENGLGFNEIALSSIRPNPRQPRRDIEPDALRELADSIKAEGLLQPIVVRRKGDTHEIIAGERRFRAYESLGRKKIPAKVMEVSDASSAALALIENLQREGLNPIEEALGYASLMRDFDLTQEEAAERVGRNRASLANVLRLLHLSKDIQSYLVKGLISTGHAKVLLSISEPSQREMIARHIIEKSWSVRETEKQVAQLAKQGGGSRNGNSSTSRDPSWVGPLEKHLTSELQARVRIKQRGKKGQLTIEYHSREELDRVLQRLQVSL